MATSTPVPTVAGDGKFHYPPGPFNPPLVGSLPAFRRDPIRFLTRVAAEFGELGSFKFGPQRVVLLNRPDLIKDVFVTHQNQFTKSRVLQRAKIVLGEGLLTAEGQTHRRHRRLVQPAFHRDRMEGYGRTMIDCTLERRARWQNGATLDIDTEMMRLTLAIVAKTLFNANVEAEAADIGRSLEAILELFNMALLPFADILQKLPLPMMRRFDQARARLDAIIYGMITERRKSAADQGDLLSMLLMAEDEESGTRFTDEQVRDEALTLFLAGHETTANALTWTWYLLSQNPEAEAKFHQEVDAVLGGRTPSVADLPNLRYTEMLFSESMRLYPPAWVIGRMNREPYEFLDYRLPAKTILMMSPYIMHRNPKYFPEPEKFQPERWLPDVAEQRPKFTYFPFGGGARICIGERFAWMEGILVLATAAQQWRFRLVPGHPVEPKPLMTLRTKHGMKMVAERRQR